MKILAYLSIVLIGLVFSACQREIQPYVLYYSSAQFKTQQGDTLASLKTIKNGIIFHKNITLVMRDRSRKEISKEGLWGYSQGDKVYRNYGDRFIRVVTPYSDSTIKYMADRSVTFWTSNGNRTMNQVMLLYSKDLDSKVYLSQRKAKR